MLKYLQCLVRDVPPLYWPLNHRTLAATALYGTCNTLIVKKCNQFIYFFSEHELYEFLFCVIVKITCSSESFGNTGNEGKNFLH